MSGEREWIERMKRDDVDGVADPQVSILVRALERAEAERDELRELLREGAHHLYRYRSRQSLEAYERWREKVRAAGIEPESAVDTYREGRGDE